jgi:hypothetical protein
MRAIHPNRIITNCRPWWPAILAALAFLSFASDADRVPGLIDVIKKGPSLYRTPEASAVFVKLNSSPSVSPVSTPEGLAAIKESIRASIYLGDMGDKARDAIPTLIDVFPQAEHVSIKKDEQYGPGVGGFDDWVQTYVISEKNKFVLTSPFIEYNTLSRCEEYVEASATTDIHQKRVVGGRIVSAVTDIYITLRINAARCALARIAGYDAGSTRDSWRQWYAKNKPVSEQPAQPAPAAYYPSSNVTSAGANPPSDYLVGGRYQINLTTGYKVTGIIEYVNDSSFTIRSDEGERGVYNKSFVSSRAMISLPPAVQSSATAPAQPAAAAGSIPYESLLDFSYSGKMMEVVIKNGSVFRGTLGVVDAALLHINVDGTEIPLSRSVIIRISPMP